MYMCVCVCVGFELCRDSIETPFCPQGHFVWKPLHLSGLNMGYLFFICSRSDAHNSYGCADWIQSIIKLLYAIDKRKTQSFLFFFRDQQKRRHLFHVIDLYYRYYFILCESVTLISYLLILLFFDYQTFLPEGFLLRASRKFFKDFNTHKLRSRELASRRENSTNSIIFII